jgi:opacity protein-like surface antigen
MAWEGSFFGYAAGSVTSTKSSQRTVPNGYTYDRPTMTSADLGIAFGHRWQSGNIVTGLTAEFMVPANPSKFINEYGTVNSHATVLTYFSHSIDVTGQLGYAKGNTLGYLTTGLAMTRTTELTISPAPAKGWSYRPGFIYGLGLETKLQPQISLGVEAIRTAYSSEERQDRIRAMLRFYLP